MVLLPDVQIDSKSGIHTYGNMIWIFFMTQYFETDIMRKYLKLSSGTQEIMVSLPNYLISTVPT